MPKNTVVLISGLVLVTVVLFMVAFRSSNKNNVVNNQVTPTVANINTPVMVPAYSVLSIDPNPIDVQPGQRVSVNVNLAASDNNVTAVQLEIQYDPLLIGTIQLTPGTMIQNPVVLINKNNIQTGRITYAIGIAPNQPTLTGTGTVATISFLAKKAGQSELTLLPTSLVTARGVSESVLKSATGAAVNAGAMGGSTSVVVTSTPSSPDKIGVQSGLAPVTSVQPPMRTSY